MTEEVAEGLKGFKIWRNPANRNEPVSYLGEFRPPAGQFFFTAQNLRNLGFAPGTYTIRAPEGGCPELFSKWQKVTVPR